MNQLARITLLLLGFWLWWAFGRNLGLPEFAYIPVALQAAAASIPPVNRWLTRQLDRLRSPTDRTRAITSLVIGIVGASYLFLSAIEQQRDLFPKFHDEYMHLIQAAMLARGRLWFAPHALPQFFETFHVFVTPVYAAMQFPGASILYVPGIWLHLPYWMTALAISGVTLGLMYRVVTELTDGVTGLLSALLLLGLLEFRYVSLMVLSNPAALLLGLCILIAWLRWRTRRTKSSAFLLGVFVGWAAITRPPDALCFALPVAIAMAIELRHHPLLHWRRALLCVTLGMLPFLCLQLTFNRGVTGHWLQTPHELYVKTFHPGLSYGGGSAARPATTLPQKIYYYDAFVAGPTTEYTPATAVRIWREQRIPVLLRANLPAMILVIFAPLGLLGLCKPRRWVLIAVLPLFILFYAPSAIFASQYCVINTVSLIPLVIVGARSIGTFVPRWKCEIETVMVVILCGIAITSLPQISPGITDQYGAKDLKAVETQLAAIHGRALVFFHYQPGVDVHQEPVYNLESADIDSCRIVRAQDLGMAENQKLIAYYHQLQPDRRVYLFDRSKRTLSAMTEN